MNTKETGFILTHPNGHVEILRDRGPDGYEMRECKIEAITFGKSPSPATHEAAMEVNQAMVNRLETELPYVSTATLWKLLEEIIALASPPAAQEQKPVARYELFKDGDAWCCVADEFTNLQECLAGFGQSPELALDDLIEKENSERERLGIPDYRKSPIPASGWVMVPKLVSDSMLTAALEKGFQGHESHLQILWTAMLAESAVAVGETK